MVMMSWRVTLTVVAVVLTGIVLGRAHGAGNAESWNAKAAAAYLDQRQEWWANWPSAARDRDTFCVSCHTAAPYALARPLLRVLLDETDLAPAERKLHDNVIKRVRLWNEVAPFYPDQTRGLPKTSESRGTEAVLNALVLSARDAGAATLSDDARLAFANMWSLQMRTGPLNGAWAWLNFHYEPWEADNGAFFGATLAAVAVANAPGEYPNGGDVKEGLDRLRSYVAREFDRQNLFNQLGVAWASSKLPGLLTSDQLRAMQRAVVALQQTDGGWSLSALGEWKRTDGSLPETRSDGYATAMVVLALQQGGSDASSAALARGVEWLRRHQDPTTGHWSATSLNKRRDPSTPAAGFMSDAATAFAVLALASPAGRAARLDSVPAMTHWPTLTR